MSNKDFLDYLNNKLLPRFNYTSVEFKISDKNSNAIYFGIGYRPRYDDEPPKKWIELDWEYVEFFGYQNSFFDFCKKLYAYISQWHQDWHQDIKQRMGMLGNDIQFIKTMSNCYGCTSIEELELRLGIIGI